MTKKRPVEVLVLALVGCYSVPESATPLSAARDGAVVAAAQERWVQEGLPDPSACETLRVLWPATADQLAHYCKRCSCEAPDCGIARGCVDACATTIAEGFGPFTTRLPVAVVSRTQPRTSYVHELGHHWQRCLGLPRDHSERFKRWLHAVEKAISEL